LFQALAFWQSQLDPGRIEIARDGIYSRGMQMEAVLMPKRRGDHAMNDLLAQVVRVDAKGVAVRFHDDHNRAHSPLVNVLHARYGRPSATLGGP